MSHQAVAIRNIRLLGKVTKKSGFIVFQSDPKLQILQEATKGS